MRPFRLWTPLPPAHVAQRLRECSELVGEVDLERTEQVLNLVERPGSWHPQLVLTVSETVDGTLLLVRFEGRVWGTQALWSTAYATFSSGLGPIKHLLRDVVQSEFEGLEATLRAEAPKVGDSQGLGADSMAPWSFDVRNEAGGAVFSLRRQRNGGATQMRINSHGLELVLGEQHRRLDWNDVVRIGFRTGLRGREVELRLQRSAVVYIAIEGHPTADQEWLVAYLRARHRHNSTADDDQDGIDEIRSKLYSFAPSD